MLRRLGGAKNKKAISKHEEEIISDLQKRWNSIPRLSPLNPYAISSPTENTQAVLDLTGKIGRQNLVRAARMLTQYPDYPKYKFAIAGALGECKNFNQFFSLSELSELQKGVYQWIKAVPATAVGSVKSPKELTFEKLFKMTAPLIQKVTPFDERDREIAITTWLRFILEGRGRGDLLHSLLGEVPIRKDLPVSLDFVSFGGRLAREEILSGKSGPAESVLTEWLKAVREDRDFPEEMWQERVPYSDNLCRELASLSKTPPNPVPPPPPAKPVLACTPAAPSTFDSVLTWASILSGIDFSRKSSPPQSCPAQGSASDRLDPRFTQSPSMIPVAAAAPPALPGLRSSAAGGEPE